MRGLAQTKKWGCLTQPPPRAEPGSKYGTDVIGFELAHTAREGLFAAGAG